MFKRIKKDSLLNGEFIILFNNKLDGGKMKTMWIYYFI